MTDLLVERFWNKIQVDENTGCWNWLGPKVGRGYGVITIDSRQRYTHRFAYEVNIGKIPESLTIDHLCKNKLCANPEHMEVVSNRENNMRGNSMSAINARKTHCKNGHPLIGSNLRVRKTGVRNCRICIRKYERDWTKDHK